MKCNKGFFSTKLTLRERIQCVCSCLSCRCCCEKEEQTSKVTGAEWNWRFIFDVELPMKDCRFYLKAWVRSIAISRSKKDWPLRFPRVPQYVCFSNAHCVLRTKMFSA